MYRSWFHKKGSEEDGPTPLEASALEDFLEGKLHPSEAAINITTSCSKEDQQEEGLPNPDWVFERLWGFILDAAQQIPDTQDQLVHLISAIKRLPDLEPDHDPVGGGMTWADLPYLHELMRDSWNCASSLNDAECSFVF